MRAASAAPDPPVSAPPVPGDGFRVAGESPMDDSSEHLESESEDIVLGSDLSQLVARAMPPILDHLGVSYETPCRGGSRDGTIRVWSIQHGVMVTAFYLHVPVVDLRMTFNAEHILVQVEEGGCAPLLCLHNSTAAEIESQSQVNIDMKDDSSSSTTSPITIPMNKPPPLEKKISSIRMPKISRKSTSSVTEPSEKKKHPKNRHQSYSDGNSSPGKAKNKRSGVCEII
ncbi:uncharacterized protein LOC117120751 [Anneissia japonica]|uniref:uncharacterized protein LOC117120751 n=1 Tax=Anneissia japonica TaxID=1529436 RepID=UPI001425766C|nr:uncharacterized protein LOC117120751 [Anneissia japonica]